MTLLALIVTHALAGTHTDTLGDNTSAYDVDSKWAATFFTADGDVSVREVCVWAARNGSSSSAQSFSISIWERASSTSSTWTQLGVASSSVSSSTYNWVCGTFRTALEAGGQYGIGLYTTNDVGTYSDNSSTVVDPSWGTTDGYGSGSYSSGTSISFSSSARNDYWHIKVTVDAVDADRDGYDTTEDCDDSDATVNPDGSETWYDGTDGDCDGASDYDRDGDGYDSDAYGGDDCDDTEASANPDGRETWYDGVDGDCDGGSDYDQDADGHDSDAYGGDDCDDTRRGVHGEARETWYDGVDSDCSGGSDYDQDGDGHDSSSYDGDDCDDTEAGAYPGNDETWYDGVDGDCSGGSDYDQDGDGHDVDGDCNDLNPEAWVRPDPECDVTPDTGGDDPDDGNGGGNDGTDDTGVEAKTGGALCSVISIGAALPGMFAIAAAAAGALRRRRAR